MILFLFFLNGKINSPDAIPSFILFIRKYKLYKENNTIYICIMFFLYILPASDSLMTTNSVISSLDNNNNKDNNNNSNINSNNDNYNKKM